VEELVVVTSEPRLHDLLSAHGVRFVADSPSDSLNQALRRGAASCRSRPDSGLAALTADLPALTANELEHALYLAVHTPTSFVPDAGGKGTTMFAARSSEEFLPQFGHRSRARHIAAGAKELLWPGMMGIRQDVDTVEDLERAWALGIGQHSRAVAADLTAGCSAP